MTALAAGGNSPAGTLIGFAVLIVAFALYWAPTFTAWRRHVRNLRTVFVINCFAFLLIPWIVAMAWSVSTDVRTPTNGPSSGQ